MVTKPPPAWEAEARLRGSYLATPHNQVRAGGGRHHALPTLGNSVLSKWDCPRQNMATNDPDGAIPGSTRVGESPARLSAIAGTRQAGASVPAADTEPH